MHTTVLIEVDVQHEAVVRRALALAEEMEQLALTAPDGTVFDACEEAILEKGRELQTQLLGAAVAQRIGAAEKRGAAPRLRLRAAEGKPRAKRTPPDERRRRGRL